MKIDLKIIIIHLNLARDINTSKPLGVSITLDWAKDKPRYWTNLL
jgi:hypothetical protein